MPPFLRRVGRGQSETQCALQDPGFNMPITNSSTYRKIYKGVLMAAGSRGGQGGRVTGRDGGLWPRLGDNVLVSISVLLLVI